MSQEMFAARDVAVHYGAYKAVNGVNLTVERGQVHSLIGPNGAGKTTLFNALCGATRLARGEIRFKGRRIERMPMASRIRAGIARSFQVTNLFPDAPVRENVRLACQAHRGWRLYNCWTSVSAQRGVQEQVDQVLDWAGLSNREARPAGELSHGEQRRLEIALAIASKPAMLFLDEPTAGMGSEDIGFAKRLIKSLAADRGIGVVLIEHNMSLVMDISNSITVLQQGQVIAEGSPSSIRSNPIVKSAYLGE